MNFSKSGLVAVSLAALVASGCSTSRFSSMDDQQPAPLQPAPAGQVTSNQLPPPASPGATDPSQFPTAPANTQVASLPPDGSAPAGASDVSAASVAGVWNASVSGQSCKIATPQTVQWILDKAIQTHGAAGLSQDTELAIAFAGIRTLRFADGPDEVHKNSLAKAEIARHTTTEA